MMARMATFLGMALLAFISGTSAVMAGTGAPVDWSIDLQPSYSTLMDQMYNFNVLVLVIIIAIVIFVFALMVWVIFRYRESANPNPSRTSHNTTIEVLWTIVPVLILVVIAIPSFRLLYQQFSFPKADVIVKTTGKQWYWSYEYPDHKNLTFDSYPVDAKDLKPGQIKLLSVDNDMVVPVNKVVHILVTAGDVIHQWTIPAFGVRADAIPGRVNRQWFVAKEPGIYYGQCSALCGQGHPYMPIAVRVVPEDEYNRWIASKTQTASAPSEKMAAVQTNDTQNK